MQHDGGGLPEMLGMGDASYGGQSLQQLPEQYGGGYASAGVPYQQQHGGFGGQQWGAPAVSSQRAPPFLVECLGRRARASPVPRVHCLD